MITLQDCKPRGLYRIDARNFSLGVYNGVSKGFYGLRYKFGNTFIDEEFHWDTGAPHGTAKPLEALPESLPESIALGEHLRAYCKNCNKPVVFRDLYEHVEASPGCEKLSVASKYNDALHEWLEKMKEKYPNERG